MDDQLTLVRGKRRTGQARSRQRIEWVPIGSQVSSGIVAIPPPLGHGASIVVMAESFPNSRFWGFDFHPPSIGTARKRAEEAGVSGRATFEVATATGYPGSYDLICFFDCLHDRATRPAPPGTLASTSNPAAPSCSSSRSRWMTTRTTSRPTRWHRCSTTPHPRSAHQTRCPRRWARHSARRSATPRRGLATWTGSPEQSSARSLPSGLPSRPQAGSSPRSKTFLVVGLIAMAVFIVVWLVARRPHRG
jgi:hypothetical protein